MSAWIMYCKDYEKWISTTTSHVGFHMFFSLPLFSINPEFYGLAKLNELILVVDTYIHHELFTLEQVEEINKTWNKFYEG